MFLRVFFEAENEVSRGQVTQKHVFLRVLFELENEVSRGQVTQKHVFLRVFARFFEAIC